MKHTFYILFWIIVSVSMRAQTLDPTILNSTGGTATINGISYDYSFGEMTMISTFSTPQLIVTQGVLQTRTDTAAVGIHENNLPAPHISIYPNPAQQCIGFESDFPTAGTLQYEFLDISGKRIINRQLTIHPGMNKETIDLTSLPTGMYLLKITVHQGNETFVQTSKIQKSN
ncbi:MAG TPA: T9SS type A sorting domain-containing protein [Bacteroidia bacterium]|nr:T9SS type A sorting domain-containing protein [Bacteroidia bacterium]